MTTNPQEELGHDPAILRAVTELSDVCLGVARARRAAGRRPRRGRAAPAVASAHVR